MGTFLFRPAGGIRHVAVVLLDSLDQQLDADPGRLSHGGRTFRPGRLAGDRLQSVLSLLPRPHRGCFPCSHAAFCWFWGGGPWLTRKKKFAAEGKVMLTTTLALLAVLVPLQILLGDMHG